jgi:hypothetical protein
VARRRIGRRVIGTLSGSDEHATAVATALHAGLIVFSAGE